MLQLYQNGASSSSLNSARSALSFFLTYEFNLTGDITVSRLFKYFYRTRPLKSKYFTYWPVKDLLNHLATLHPPSNLTLKELTLKTLALVALTSSDRGQSLQLMNIDNYYENPEGGLSFVIFDILEHTRRVLKPKVINCISSDSPALDVGNYVRAYIEATDSIREKHLSEGRQKPTQLFISWLTKAPSTRSNYLTIINKFPSKWSF